MEPGPPELPPDDGRERVTPPSPQQPFTGRPKAAELVADLIESTALVPPDRLALVGAGPPGRVVRRGARCGGACLERGRRSYVRRASPPAARRSAADRSGGGGEHADAASRPPPRGRTSLPARGRDLHIAIADPQNVQAIDELRLATRYQLSLGVAPRDDILAELDRMGRVSTRLSIRSRTRGRGEPGSPTSRRTTASPKADRPHRQLDDAPGGRGRGERRPLRGAGGRPRRPVRIDGVLHEMQRIPSASHPG